MKSVSFISYFYILLIGLLSVPSLVFAAGVLTINNGNDPIVGVVVLAGSSDYITGNYTSLGSRTYQLGAGGSLTMTLEKDNPNPSANVLIQTSGGLNCNFTYTGSLTSELQQNLICGGSNQQFSLRKSGVSDQGAAIVTIGDKS